MATLAKLFGKLKASLSGGEELGAPARPRGSGLEQRQAPPQNLTGGRRTLSTGELLELQRDAQVRKLDDEARAVLRDLEGRIPAPLIQRIRSLPRHLEPRSWEHVRSKALGLQGAAWDGLESALPLADRSTREALAALPAFEPTAIDAVLTRVPEKQRPLLASALAPLSAIDPASRRVILRSPQQVDVASLERLGKAYPAVPPELLRAVAAALTQLPAD